jgi:hypothetical protein
VLVISRDVKHRSFRKCLSCPGDAFVSAINIAREHDHVSCDLGQGNAAEFTMKISEVFRGGGRSRIDEGSQLAGEDDLRSQPALADEEST